MVRDLQLIEVLPTDLKERSNIRSYDSIEKEGSLKGKVADIIHDPGRSAPSSTGEI